MLCNKASVLTNKGGNEMNLIYSALMLHEAKKEINEDNVKKLVQSIGIKVDDAQIKALVTALDGVDIDDAISKSVSTAPVAISPAAVSGESKIEEKAEKEEEKASEEEAAAGLAGLFG